MIKANTNTSALTTPYGIAVNSSPYGKAVKLIYGLAQAQADLTWANNWQSHGSPVNSALAAATGLSTGKKSSGKKGGGTKYYSAAVDFLLGHNPILGILSSWYNNQKFIVDVVSASGVVADGQFSFTPTGTDSTQFYTGAVPSTPLYTIQVPNFVADLNNVRLGQSGANLQPVDPSYPPGAGEYTVNDSGLYTFNAAQAGQPIWIPYRALTAGDAVTMAGILAVAVREPFNAAFNDFGAPGSVTEYGTWDNYLWHAGAYAVPGRIDSGAFHARDPYTWSWDGSDPTVTVPAALNGLPITVWYGVPAIMDSNGNPISGASTTTPLALLNLEFEAAQGSGAEYTSYGSQRVVMPWVAGLGSVSFDLGAANSIPNINYEVIGAFALWPNGDADVADVILDIVSSGPVLLPSGLTVIGHGLNCNAYANGGALAPTFPPGNGVLFGDLSALNNWCHANGISVSLCLDAQRTAKDLLDELLLVGNSAAVYSGSLVNVIPYDEVSSADNGAIYTSPTASGPAAYLTDEDFVCDGKTPPVKLTRKRRGDCDNTAAVEYIDRSIDYAHNVTTSCDQKAVALFGPRKGGSLSGAEIGERPSSGSKSLLSISSGPVAQATGSVLAKRSAAGVNQYAFELKAERFMLEAMDLVAITDTRLGLNQLPVRLTSVKESEKRTYACQADEFHYGLNHPDAKGMTTVSGSLVKSNISPGIINTPIIFEPTQELASGHNLAFVVSGVDPNYGGCAAFVSFDGGESYSDSPVAVCGQAQTGVLAQEYPAGVDPDTIDELLVNMSECGGEVPSVSQAEADASLNRCYIGDATGYEIICPGGALPIGDSEYESTYVRRGLLGTTSYSHHSGSRFAVLDGSVAIIAVPTAWFGKNLWFKFAAVNKNGGQQQSLADCTAYEYSLASLTPPTPVITSMLQGIPGGLQFSFEMSGDMNVAQYWIYRNTVDDFATAQRWLPYPGPTTPESTTISDVGMNGGATYWYWVVAVSIDGLASAPAPAQTGEIYALSPLLTEADELTTSLGIPIVTSTNDIIDVLGVGLS